uniref:Helicase ATP-binding domain-containing protein n=1 Tax=Mesocestoides corti TaxID=53468 RepID=A0A5K3FA09_MESCO
MFTRKVTSVHSSKQQLLKARPYQVEIANLAFHESIIAKLNTGLGKTFIAVMVIKHHLPETYRPLNQGGRRIIFITKTVHLVYQQASFLRQQLPVHHDEIGVFHGQVAPGVWIDSWGTDIWQAQLEKHRVLVATAGVFRDVFNHRKINMRNICLVIFDECHHADPDSKSDFVDICQHLHDFPPGKWLPDYSRGPKVLGLTASVVNTMKRGENLEVKVRRLEELMRARIVTTVDDSIKSVSGNRERQIVAYSRGGSQAYHGELYWPVAQVLQEGVKDISLLTCKGDEAYIDLEVLLDKNKQVRKEAFLNVMELQDFNQKKLGRVLKLCLRVMEEFGPWCANHACEQIEKTLWDLLKLTTFPYHSSNDYMRLIRKCLDVLTKARNLYQQLREQKIASLPRPSSQPTDPAWGDWILGHYPMSLKTIQILRTLVHLKKLYENKGGLSALLLVQERIASLALSRLICGVSEMAPLYAGLKASYCVSANPTRNLASMSTAEQLNVLDGFQKGLFNILVATTVVEEGLDVRSCNAVIKADALTNYRSFIQSQGRARAAESKFIVLTDDKHKCQSDISNFLSVEMAMEESLVSRRVEVESDDDDNAQYLDVNEIRKLSFLPFGIDGPRITPSSAPSVLMRYIASLKTDTSYPLKILYSSKKHFGGYQTEMLMPPPSPLQEIIKGPVASNSSLAKQLARIEACKKLYDAGLLDDDLLPYNFRRLIEVSKRNEITDQSDSMAEILSKMHRIRIHQPTSGEGAVERHDNPPNVMSQALLLLTPIEGDIFTNDGVLSDSSVSEYSSIEYTNDHDLPHGIVLTTSTDEEDENGVEEENVDDVDMQDNTKTSSAMYTPMTKQASCQQPVWPYFQLAMPQTPETVPSSARAKTCAAGLAGQSVREEVSSQQKKSVKSSRTSSKARFYEIHRLHSLSAPYQRPIAANQPVYVYTWQLPSPAEVAHLTRVDPECFKYANQTIGLVFSKPISKLDFVCRFPLYLQSGMVRIELRKASVVTFTEEQLSLIQRTHEILSQLSVDISRPENFDLRFENGGLSFYSAPKLMEPSSVPKSNAVAIDPFSEIAIDPEEAHICAMFLIVRLPSGSFDEEASRALVSWSDEKDHYLGGGVKVPPQAEIPRPIIQSGICSRFGLQLSALPPNDWPGVLVRPICLPQYDPGSYAVNGVNPNGLRGLSLINQQMASCLPENIQSGASFLAYFDFKYHSVLETTCQCKGFDPDAPLASVTRISRHLNASNVAAGFAAVEKEVSKEDVMPDLCVIHPLNTWLWLTLCLIPNVLHQIFRCLSTCELRNLLCERLYCESSCANPSEPQFGLPDGGFLMPDRDSVSLSSIPALRKFLIEEQEASSSVPHHPVSEFNAMSLVPPASCLYEAVTAVGAKEAVNLERLELLGDSLLKFASSLRVYATSPPNTDEGQLTFARSAFISNTNLHRLSIDLGLHHYFRSSDFKSKTDYLPPYYFLFDKTKASTTHDSRLFERVYDKSIADSIEALLGVFLLNLEPSCCARLLYFLKVSNQELPMATQATSPLEVASISADYWRRHQSWVPMLLKPEHHAIDPELTSKDAVVLARRSAEVERLIIDSLPREQTSTGKSLDSTKPVYPNHAQALENKQMQLESLEEILGYKFRKIGILIQATTHPSSLLAYHWGCYQRLEFLGDAILDFVVTQRIFKDHPDMNPGQLTDLRAALVSNINLAVVAVRFGIHKYLEQTDPSLWKVISNFSEVLNNDPSKLWQLEDECYERNESLGFKVLGDMVEAIIGAIYVDSGGVTNVVTSVIFHLLEREFGKSRQFIGF